MQTNLNKTTFLFNQPETAGWLTHWIWVCSALVWAWLSRLFLSTHCMLCCLLLWGSGCQGNHSTTMKPFWTSHAIPNVREEWLAQPWSKPTSERQVVSSKLGLHASLLCSTVDGAPWLPIFPPSHGRRGLWAEGNCAVRRRVRSFVCLFSFIFVRLLGYWSSNSNFIAVSLSWDTERLIGHCCVLI